MTREKWLNTVSSVEEQFRVLEKDVRSNEDLSSLFSGWEIDSMGLISVDDTQDVPAAIEYLVFVDPTGIKTKFEYRVGPRYVKEKTLFAKRLGSNVKVEKLYDTNDLVRTFIVYQERGGEWEEVKA